MIWIADRVSVDRNGASLDQRLEPAARQLGDVAREHTIKTLAGFLVADDE